MIADGKGVRSESVEVRLAHHGKGRKPQPAIFAVSQDTLAQMVGTTRSSTSHFMNTFRTLGYNSYNGGRKVHASLRGIARHD